VFLSNRSFQQLRGDKTETRGTAFVVFEDIYDAKNAVDHLSGFNVCGRYLIVLYYQPTKMQKNVDNAAKKKEIEEMKAQFGLNKSKEEA
jgi:pre-mRNA branch site protein p14